MHESASTHGVLASGKEHYCCDVFHLGTMAVLTDYNDERRKSDNICQSYERMYSGIVFLLTAHIRNVIGPKILPCGMPLSTENHCEKNPLILTRCFLLHKKSCRH